MIRLLQRKLIIPRGDTGTFSIPALIQFSAGDVAIFSILDKLTQTTVLTKIVELTESDTIIIDFNHNDTVNLKPGEYYWDIKIYHLPVYVNDELVDAEEIHSYYAGYGLPECEIKETGDSYITANEEPLSAATIDIINNALNTLRSTTSRLEDNNFKERIEDLENLICAIVKNVTIENEDETIAKVFFNRLAAGTILFAAIPQIYQPQVRQYGITEVQSNKMTIKRYEQLYNEAYPG